MFLSFYPKMSPSSVHEHWENMRLQTNLAHAEKRLEALYAAYVISVDYLNADPARRFRALLPDGQAVYRATREEAEKAINDAAGV